MGFVLPISPMITQHLHMHVSMLLSLIQAAAQSAAQGLTPSGPVTAFHEPLSTKVTASAVTVYVLELIKKWKALPWITSHTKYINRAASVLAAGAGAIGIHSTFDHASGTLIISGLSLATVIGGAWAWLQQFVFNEIIYQGAVNKQPPPVVP